MRAAAGKLAGNGSHTPWTNTCGDSCDKDRRMKDDDADAALFSLQVPSSNIEQRLWLKDLVTQGVRNGR